MAGGQVQIVRAGPTEAPVNYKLPATAPCIPICINADFDGSGAAGAYLPAVVFVGASGTVIARAADQAVSIAAGGDAEVSFFPGVKNGAAGVTSAAANQSALFQKRAANQAITTGTITAITFTTFTSSPGYTPGLFGTPVAVQNPITFADFGTALFTLIVDFEAAAYDRYIEMTIANPDIAQADRSPRIRSQVTPDGDRLVLSAAIEGGAGAPATTVTANVFQASGANKNITATWIAHGFKPHIFLF